MFNKIASLVNPLISSSVAAKGLGKIDKRLQNFFIGAGLSGYGTNEAVDYLRDQFSNNGSVQDNQRLDQRAKSGLARPDELASLKESQRNEQVPRAVKGALSAVGGITGGLAALDSFDNLGSSSQGRANIQPEPQMDSAQKVQGASKDRSKPESVLSRDSLQEQAAEMVDPDEALKAFSQLLQKTGDPRSAADQLRTLPQYRQVVPYIEKRSGMQFSDWAMQNLQRSGFFGQNNGQNGQQNGQVGKDVFLSELGKLSQMLQGIKR